MGSSAIEPATQSDPLPSPDMSDMTAGEIARAFQDNKDAHRGFVSKDIHETVIAELRADISEIKESQKWAMRLLVSNFLGLVVAVVIFVATRGIG